MSTATACYTVCRSAVEASYATLLPYAPFYFSYVFSPFIFPLSEGVNFF